MGVYRVGPPEAEPGPLPGAGPYLRLFTGADQPSTAWGRAAVQMLFVWRRHFDAWQPGQQIDPEVEEGLSYLGWVIDRETKAMLAEGPFPAAEAPLHRETYGDLVGLLAWRYLQVGLLQDRKPDVSREIHQLNQQIEALDTLVADVEAGRVRLRLPEK